MANSSARAIVDVGSVIADTYTIEGLIGKGGMGTVFLASHNRLPGKTVAIKLLHTDHGDEEILARFRREALIASQLNHPNIVAVHDFNVMADGTPYLILEFLRGESLASRLDARGALGLEAVFAVMRQVGAAMAAAHQHGIVHRDLKPQNIFLVPVEADGGVVEIAKVLDFGISKIRGSSTVKTQESSLLGTPQYMAPEQATGQHANVDERTDVFALGAIAYEMIAGRPAFSGASIPEVVFKVVYEQPPSLAEASPDTPPHVIDAIMKAMEKQSSDRFATVSDFIEALTGLPIPARPSLDALPSPDIGFATGSRIRPPGTGGGKSGVGRSGGAPMVAPKTPSQPGRDNPAGLAATSAPGRELVGGETALASTVDSGSHPPAVSPERVVPPGSQTVASLHPGDAHPVIAPPVVQVPARKRPIALMVGIGVALVASAAFCVYLVVKGGGQPGTDRPEPLARGEIVLDAGGVAPLPAIDAAPSGTVDHAAPVDAALAPPVDAGAEIARPGSAAVPTDAGVAVKPADKKPLPEAPLTEDEKVAKQRVERALAALARNTPEGNIDALRLANSVTDSEAKRFHGRASAVQGVLKCRGNLPFEAKAILGRLRGDPAARAILVRGCKQAGTQL